MIQVRTDGPVEDKYKKWREKAKKARDTLIKEWEATGKTPEPNEVIWGELKDLFLLKVFHQKCAYCEQNVSANNPFHVEHYRPKKMVTENRKVVEKHGGYFWLAYEWYNLLLACNNCNTSHSERVEDEKIGHPGKANEFRVSGKRVFKPGKNPDKWQSELEKEEPLLLNPYDEDNPEKHITFDAHGFIYPKEKSKRGQETIDVCNLKRIELVEARRREAEIVLARVVTRVCKRAQQLKAGEKPDRSPYFDCAEPFSAWLNHYATLITKEL